MDKLSDMIDEHFYTVELGKVYDSIISHIDKLVIMKALEHTDGNQVRAAKILGLHRNTLRYKIKQLNIDMWRFKR